MSRSAASADRAPEADAASDTTTTGVPAPAAKCADETSSPMTESGWPRNAALFDSPLASSVNRPSAMTPSASAVPTHTMRGRLEILRPVCAQKPLAVGSTEPYAGLLGQNTQRPQITNRAGSSDSIAH